MKAKRETFFAVNRHNKTATILTGFSCWEMVQGGLMMGIQLPDGTRATGIGRLKSVADFTRRALTGGHKILVHDDSPHRLEIEVNGSFCKVAPDQFTNFLSEQEAA